jgi:type I restriction enzyme S subunit
MGQSPSSNQCSTKNIGTPFLQGCAEFGKEHPISNQFCIFPPKICPGGAILLSVRAPVGRLNVADQEYCIGRGLCAVVPFDSVLQRAFVRYALEVGTRGLQQLSTGSTYDAVSIGDISIQPISIPPIDEQASIIRFLDWANERFGRAIQAKQKVISLLREQKQAIILHAVTKGLDPSVSLKPLGIPWLEGIPQHWEIKRAKYIFREVDHRSVDGNEELLSVSHITGVTPRSQKNITMFKAESYAGHKLCSPGDLVINTMWAWAGALGVTSYSGIVSPSYAVYRPYYPEKIVIGYIDELLRTSPYISNIICHSTGLRPSRLRFYPEDFLRLHIIQPPIIEQQAIVESIRVETARFNAAIARLEHEIGLIHEYRTRLDADVVTGKVDVREATARLPIETHDSNEMILDSNELAIPSDLDDKEVEV